MAHHTRWIPAKFTRKHIKQFKEEILILYSYPNFIDNTAIQLFIVD